MRELIPVIEALSTGHNGSPVKSKTKQTGIRAVLFDAGDVLYFRPERGRYLRDFHHEVGRADKIPPHEETVSLQHQAFMGSITQDEYRRSLLGLHGITDPALLEKGRQAMEADDNNVQFFEGVSETLQGLKAQGFLLGIITDTANPLHVKLKWFRDAGIVHVWDSIISSQEVGIQKPAPEIYRAALDQMNLEASQVVFVGHDADELQGARGVGIKTIAFNHGNDAEADYYIENFTDLLSVPILSQDQMALKV
jgi:putative hydrolase of the HAD superfamily